MWRLRRAFLAVAVSLLLLSIGSDGLHISPVKLAALPYKYDIVTWELTHLPSKWFHKTLSLLPWNSQSREEKLGDLREYFRLGDEINALEGDVARVRTLAPETGSHFSPSGSHDNSPELNNLRLQLRELQKKRSDIRASAEEAMESEISAVLNDEGLELLFGIIIPPVDIALTDPPRLLVISPRDRIDRSKSVLLESDMTVEEMEQLEDKIFKEQGLSALVSGLGGVATYPTIVRDSGSLERAAILTAHEWLHTYWFFRPLGWNMFDSPVMNTLNETAASVAGDVIGVRAYRAVVGDLTEDSPASETGEAEPIDDFSGTGDRFDFNLEMRVTRLRVDELLAEGNVEEAEAYMEERRLTFVENGFLIRKLNQAYFAFHGTYATGPASVSPIGDQVTELLGTSPSIGDFVRTMSRFGSYQEFLDYLKDAPPLVPGVIP